jgi:hypothetical protein
MSEIITSLVRHRTAEKPMEIKVLPVIPPPPTVKRCTIVIDRVSWDLMNYFVKNNPIECLWYSQIEPYPTSNPTESVAFYIKGVYIPFQTAAAKEVEATAQQRSQMYQDLRKSMNLDTEGLKELIKTTQVWCHSHVEMPPIPSPVDDEEWKKMIETADKNPKQWPVAMIILNKEGRYTNRIYDPVSRLQYQNVEMLIEDTVDYSYVEEAIQKKVAKKEPPKTPVPAAQTSWPNHGSSPSANANNNAWDSHRSTTSTTTTKRESEGAFTFRCGESSLIVHWEDKKKVETKLPDPPDPTNPWDDWLGV